MELKVSTIFEAHPVNLDFLVVEKSPLGVIIGVHKLLPTRAKMGFEAQFVLLHINSEVLLLSLEPDSKSTEKKLVEGDGLGIYNGDLRSESKVGPDSSE